MRTKAVTGIVLTVLLIGMLALTFSIDGGYVLAGGSWHIETVDSAGDVGYWTSIALDSGDHPHISYYDGNHQDLKYAYHDGSTWHIKTVDSAGATGLDTSIAVDSGDHPHISYGSTHPRSLKCAYHDGSTWHIETVDSVDVGEYTSIAVDSGDHPHISYHDDTNEDLKYAYYYEWTPVGGVWVSVDKFGLLAPYIALAVAVVAVIVGTVYAKKRWLGKAFVQKP